MPHIGTQGVALAGGVIVGVGGFVGGRASLGGRL